MKKKSLAVFLLAISLKSIITLGMTPKEGSPLQTGPVTSDFDIIYVSGYDPSDRVPFSISYTGELAAPEAFPSIRWSFDGVFDVGSNNLEKTSYMFGSSGVHKVKCYVIFKTLPTRLDKEIEITITGKEYVTGNCCDGSFAPIPGKKYIVSAWVKENIAGKDVNTYPNPFISLLFAWGNSQQESLSLGPFHSKGLIIEGWQRIEETFIVPELAETITVELNNQGDNKVFFDDIRIFPFEGNMKSYVYDPDTKRLIADLDQNNYATIYEYNDEGEMIRVKKETERGIMTISESRSGMIKKDNPH